MALQRFSMCLQLSRSMSKTTFRADCHGSWAFVTACPPWLMWPPNHVTYCPPCPYALYPSLLHLHSTPAHTYTLLFYRGFTNVVSLSVYIIIVLFFAMYCLLTLLHPKHLKHCICIFVFTKHVAWSCCVLFFYVGAVAITSCCSWLCNAYVILVTYRVTSDDL